MGLENGRLIHRWSECLGWNGIDKTWIIRLVASCFSAQVGTGGEAVGSWLSFNRKVCVWWEMFMWSFGSICLFKQLFPYAPNVWNIMNIDLYIYHRFRAKCRYMFIKYSVSMEHLRLAIVRWLDGRRVLGPIPLLVLRRSRIVSLLRRNLSFWAMTTLRRDCNGLRLEFHIDTPK